MGKKLGGGLAPRSDRKIPPAGGGQGPPRRLRMPPPSGWQGLHEGPWPAQAGSLQVW